MQPIPYKHNAYPYWKERVDLAAAFRWAARLDLHEAVANHFSLAVNEEGTRFLMNPNQVHFSRIHASDLLELDANEPDCLSRADAPDPTAWGLHASLHRHCKHARCVMHVHSIHATVLASLKDSSLPPADQNTAYFYRRYVIDEQFGGLSFEEEGKRCAGMLQDANIKVLIMGNHGVMVLGDNVADTFNRLYYFERAAKTCILALQTGRALRVLPHEVAEETAGMPEEWHGHADRHFTDLKAILDRENSDYAQ